MFSIFNFSNYKQVPTQDDLAEMAPMRKIVVIKPSNTDPMRIIELIKASNTDNETSPLLWKGYALLKVVK